MIATGLIVTAALVAVAVFALASRPVALGFLITLQVLADVGSAAGDPAGVGFYLKLAIFATLSFVVLSTTNIRLPRHARRIVFWSCLLIAWAAIVAVVTFGWNQSLLRDLIQYTSYVLIFVVAIRWGLVDRGSLARSLLAATTLPLMLVVLGGLWGIDYFMFDGRATGAFSHPNAAAAFAGATFVAAFAFVVFARSKLSLVPLVLSSIALIITTSITTLIAVSCTLLLLFLLSRAVSTGAKVVSLGLLVITFSIATAIPVIAGRIAEFASTDAEIALASGTSANSFEWRLLNWDLLLRAWQERPILGYGLGSTADAIMPLGSIPHSMPLEILVEFGLVATVIVLIVGITSWFAIARYRRQRRWEAELLLALFVYVVVGGVASNLISYNGPIALVLLLVGLLVKLLIMAPDPTDLGAVYGVPAYHRRQRLRPSLPTRRPTASGPSSPQHESA